MLITEMKGRRNVQGNELCFQGERGFYFFSGTRCLNRSEPHAGLGEVLQIKTPFTQWIQKRGEEEKKTCTFFFSFLFFSLEIHVSQAAEPTKQCVSETMRACVCFPAGAGGLTGCGEILDLSEMSSPPPPATRNI